MVPLLFPLWRAPCFFSAPTAALSQRRVRLGAESYPRAKIHPPIARLTASTDPIVGWSGRRRRWAVAIEPAASRARICRLIQSYSLTS